MKTFHLYAGLTPGAFLLLALASAGCGRTEFEWDQKVREVEALSSRVGRVNLEKTKADEDMARLQDENAALRAELTSRSTEKGGEQRMYLERATREREVFEQQKARMDGLRGRMSSLITEGAQVWLRKGQITITLPASLLFEGKNPEVSPKGKQYLHTVAEAILADNLLVARYFLVTAHETPGKNEEGAIGRTQARATSVREFLVGRKGGLPPARWSAAGRGVADPAIGDDKADAAKNQRIELVALPEPGEILTP